MTVERKVVAGLEDLKAVSLECTECRARITISPDQPRIPRECPNCQHNWRSKVVINENFLDALSKIRTEAKALAKLAKTGGAGMADQPMFSILLEFDEAELVGRS